MRSTRSPREERPREPRGHVYPVQSPRSFVRSLTPCQLFSKIDMARGTDPWPVPYRVKDVRAVPTTEWGVGTTAGAL